MLIRNQLKDVWDPMYDVTYHVVCVIGSHLKLKDISGKIHKVNVQDVRVAFPVDELIKCLPHEKAF